MQTTTHSSSNLDTVLRFGEPVGHVQDSTQYIQNQFELDGRAPFDSSRFLKIIIGRNTSNVDEENLSAFLRTRRIVPHWDGVSITADLVAWTTTWEGVVQGRLPHVLSTIVTVYDKNKGVQKTTLDYNDHDFPPLPLSFVSIPVDELQAEDAPDIFHLPGLQTLILLPPKSQSAFRTNIRGITQTLVHSLRKVTSLRKVKLTLDFFTGVKEIIEALKDIPGITTLELMKPTSFDIYHLDLPRRIELDNALLRSMEPFPGLERLVLDEAILSLPLLDMFGRMFAEKVIDSDGRSVIFQAPHPLLFQDIPLFLL